MYTLNNIDFDIIDYPDHGSLTSNSNRAFASYVYIPDNNYYGQDYFIFTVSDGISSSEATANIISYRANPVQNMQQLLGESNETEDSVGRDCGEHPHNECGDRGRARECN